MVFMRIVWVRTMIFVHIIRTNMMMYVGYYARYTHMPICTCIYIVISNNYFVYVCVGSMPQAFIVCVNINKK